MSPEAPCTIKAAFIIALLAVAKVEANPAQQDIRFNDTFRFFDKHSAHSASRVDLHSKDLDNATLAKPRGRSRSVERRNAVIESVDRFIDDSYGSGRYQLRVLLLAGALYATTFPMTQLSVFTLKKMIDDPNLPQFTFKSVSKCQSLVFVGWALGTLAWGPAFDRYGRRLVTYALALGSGLGFTLTAIATFGRGALYTYAASAFIMGLCLPCFQGAYTMVQEIYPSNRRATAIAGINVAYSVGLALMALFCGTVTRHLNWHLETFLWSGLFTLIVVIGYPLLHESIRFLVACGRTAEASVVSQAMSATNGVDWIQLRPIAIRTSISKKALPGSNLMSNFFKAVKSSRLCERQAMLRLLACTVNWITTNLCYYGLTFAAGEITKNIYLNVALFAVVDILGYFAPAPVLMVLGRIRTIQVTLVICATFLLACAYLPHGSWMLLTCVLVGRISIDTAFMTTYLVTAESFTSDCRSTAFGISSSIGRGMCLLAPLMSNLPLSITCKIFPAMCVFAAAVSQSLPETKGCAMDDEFRS